MKKNSEIIKQITEGAIYVAIYGLLSLLTRYLITGTDSFIYYLYPLPIAIYTAKNKFKFSITTLLASTAISFLFGNPIYVLMLIIPNLLIGFLFGIVDIRIKSKLISVIILFAFCLGADFLSVYAYEKIYGIDYWNSMVEFVMGITKDAYPIDLVARLVKVISVAVLVLDSIVKEVLLYLLYIIIIMRLKLIKDYKPNFKIIIKYSPFISLTYILIMIGLFFVSNYYVMYQQEWAEIFMVILLVVSFLIGMYILYQVMFYMKIKLFDKKMSIQIIMIILLLLLFPISLIFGLILNFIRWNFINAAMQK